MLYLILSIKRQFKLIKLNTNHMILFLLVLILTIGAFFIFRNKKQKEKEQEIREKKLVEEIENLKIQQNKEDQILNKKTSILCSDGVYRIYCGYMYGIIKEKKIIEEKILAYERSDKFSTSLSSWKQRGAFEIKDFDINPINTSFRVVAFLSYFEEKWFSSEGEILDKNDIIKYRLNEIEKKQEYKRKYLSSRRKNNWISQECHDIYFINGIYFVEVTTFGKTINFDTFNGSINGILYVDGFLPNSIPVKNLKLKENLEVNFNNFKKNKMSLEVPDYSPIFDKFQKELDIAIINYVKGTLEGVDEYMAFKNDPKMNDSDREYSIQKLFCSSYFATFLPEMDDERRKLEDEVVGDDEDEAYDSGFFGECDEQWDGYITSAIDTLIEEGKLW